MEICATIRASSPCMVVWDVRAMLKRKKIMFKKKPKMVDFGRKMKIEKSVAATATSFRVSYSSEFLFKH